MAAQLQGGRTIMALAQWHGPGYVYDQPRLRQQLLVPAWQTR